MSTASAVAETVVTEKPPDLGVRATKAIDAIKAAFDDFVGGYNILSKRSTEIAPKFMHAFYLWRKKTKGDFVSFVRVLVPDVPLERDGYRNHDAYNSAMYLKKKAEEEATPKRAKNKKHGAKTVTSDVESARILAIVIPLVEPAGIDTMWAQLSSNLGWNDRKVSRMKKLVDKEKPAVVVRSPRGIKIAHALKIVKRAA